MKAGRFKLSLAVVIALAVPILAQDEPGDDAPTTSTSQPATTQSANVSPQAKPVLAKLAAAYAAAQPMQFAGKIVGDFDVAGRARHYELNITGRTDGNGKFWHYGSDATGRGGGLLTSDGVHGYLYDQRRNTYAELDAAAGRRSAADFEAAISDVLLDENPALLLTLAQDGDELLRRATQSVALSDAGQLVLTLPDKTITFDLDPATSRIAKSTIDYTSAFAQRGADAKTGGVKSVRAILTYTHADLPPATDSYAWSPPATATQFTLHRELMKPAKK